MVHHSTCGVVLNPVNGLLHHCRHDRTGSGVEMVLRQVKGVICGGFILNAHGAPGCPSLVEMKSGVIAGHDIHLKPQLASCPWPGSWENCTHVPVR